MSLVRAALAIVGMAFAAVGIYLSLYVDRFLGAGLVLVAAALFIIPYTRQKY